MPSAPTFRHAARPPTASTCAGTTAGSQREPSRNGTTTGAVRMKTPSTGNTTAAFARITARAERLHRLDRPRPREEREQDLHEDAAELVLVVDPEQVRAVVVARAHRPEGGADDRVVDVARAGVGEAGDRGRQAEADHLAELAAVPARPRRRRRALVHREARDAAGEQAEQQRLGVEPGDREAPRTRRSRRSWSSCRSRSGARTSSSRSSSARGTMVSPEMRNIGATSGSSSGTRAPNSDAGQGERDEDGEEAQRGARDDAHGGDGLDVAARDVLALDERRAVAGPRQAVRDLVDDHHDGDRAELRRRDEVGQDDHRREREDLRPEADERRPADALDRRLGEAGVDRLPVPVVVCGPLTIRAPGPPARTRLSASTTSSWSASVSVGLSGRLSVRSEMSVATGRSSGAMP